MKKTTLLLTALLLLGYSAQAQWRAGVFGGAVWNHYSIDTHYMADLKYRGQWGPSAGIAGQYNFADWLGVRAELNMTAKNYRQQRTFESLSGTDYVTANSYLQLPVMASFSFGGSFVRGFLNLGGYGAWWCSSHLKGKYINVTSDQVTDVDEDFVFDSTRDNRTEWGLAGGVGVEWRFLSHWAVQAEARCYYGLTSTQKDYMIIQDLHKEGKLKGVVIDLRGNTGGYSSDYAYVLGALLPSGGHNVSSARFKSGVGRLDYSPLTPNHFPTMQAEHAVITEPVVVLANSNTVSMAELTCLGAKAMDNAVVMGGNTWGGLSLLLSDPEYYSFAYASSIGVRGETPFYAYIPTSSTISDELGILEGVGVTPDIPIALDANLFEATGRDNQLERALQYIRTGE